MSKSANAGELRTKVYFMSVSRETDSENVSSEIKENIFGENVPLLCKWVNYHGNEIFQALELKLREPATITCRFSPLIHCRLIVYKENDPAPYDIISVDDVENRHKWLEIKVQRKEAAR